jgi:hypothetical protein
MANRKRKTRYKNPKVAGGKTLVKLHPEEDEKGRNIYFRDLGKKGQASFQKKYYRTVVGTSKYAIVNRETERVVAVW